MRGWTIRQRVFASFAVIVVLMIVIAAVVYTRLTRISQETEAVQSISIPSLYYNMALQDAWSNDFLLTEEYVLQVNPSDRQRIKTKIQSNRAELDKLVSTYGDSKAADVTGPAIQAFKDARAAYTRLQEEILAGSGLQATPAVLQEIQSKLEPEFDRAMNAVSSGVTQSRTHAEASGQQVSADVSTVRFGVLIAVIATLLATLMCFITLGRAYKELKTLVGQVEESGIKVNTSVTEIAATAKEQQATSSEIAATTTEISATSREISATSKELVKTMADVSAVAEQSATLAGNGQVGLTHMEETMRQVMDAAGSVNAKLTTLNEKAGDISQVVTTITKVADQTNLLSLNAAIEAEKAGEYGRGFAVVATEIRRLADQTAVATYDIDQMVKAIQSAVSAGVMSMDRFSEDVRRGMQAVQDVSGLLTQVIQQVQALAPRFEAVTEGMQTQATGAEQITEALAQLSEAARQTVDSLRQSNIAIDDLNQVSLGLRSGVSRFTLQVA
jgi:methyl-accepting chemotaxis protein WspA